MSDETTKGPPALPGEVWRGMAGKYICAVADPSAEKAEEPGGEGLWCRVPDIWGRAHLDRWEPAEQWQWTAILRAWALHERARAAKAEALAAAERALRRSIEAGESTRIDEQRLRALGVEP